MTYPPPPGQGPNPNPGWSSQQPGEFPAAPPVPAMPQYPGGVDPSLQKPNGGTAIAAGVLAALGAVAGIVFAALNLQAAVETTIYPNLQWVAWMQGLAYVIEVLTLGPGSVMLFLRRIPGRWLVVIGCVVQVLQAVIALVTVLSSDEIRRPFGVARSELAGRSLGGLLVVLAPAIATFILALLPQTKRWVEWGKPQPFMQPYGQPPAGYGPPPQGF